ncbi:MAG TPA: SpoIIE family protein phosphatase, partial [Alphaproteobacteria bacterium]|nr:SpoIIE family protein phosphatase [Alphaproteobacteria bacterium]
LNRLVKSSLRQDRADAPSDDGLDAMIVFVSPQTRRLVYAGARLSLLYARGGEMMELKADRTSLGYKSCNADYIFANHVVTTEPEMAFYLATDGITDQVGGPRRRMFGRQRLTATLQTVQGRPMAEQRAAVLAAVESYQGGEARRDDRTLIGFRLRG